MVDGVSRQAGGIDVDRMSEGRHRHSRTRGNHLGHVGIDSDLPGNFNVAIGQPGRRVEPGPQDY